MKPLKIAAYIRVSTDDQANVFEGSLDTQKYRIKEFVDYKNRQQEGWGEIVDFYIEEGVSAGTTNRPMYQKVMSDIRRGKVNLILVSDLTRLSRNLLDFCNLIAELEKNKASYLSMKEQFDTSTPIGRMLVYIVIALGQFERETTSERVSTNCHTRAVKGYLNGGAAPLGYNKNPEAPGILMVNEAEAEIVRTIFNTFLEEGSRAKTIERLREMGIRLKRTSKKAKEQSPVDLTVQSLGSILRNTTYVGLREVNKCYQHEDSSSLKPWQRYSVVKAQWPAILDTAIFNDAQHLLDEAAKKERTRLGKREMRVFLLSGLLTCGETGLPLVGQAGHGSSGVIHRYYHYVRKPKDLTDVRSRLNADELEEKVLQEFKTALTTKGYFENLEEVLKDHATKSEKGSNRECERVKNELADINQRISAIWANQGRMQLSEDALRLASEELNRLALQKKDYEKYMTQLGSGTVENTSIKEQSLFVENQIRWCLQGWEKATPAMRKRLLRRTIKSLVITRDEIQMTFWVSAMERDIAIWEANEIESEGAENIIPFRRRSPKIADRNLPNESSGKVVNGSEGGT